MRQNRKIKGFKGKRFALVVDGECEFWYIQMLKRNERKISINLEPKIPQKKTLKEQRDLVFELSNHYDKVFWILDFDVINSETLATVKGNRTPLNEFREYYNEITNIESIDIIINTPCLEFWFLNHFGFSTKYYESCDKVIHELKKKPCLADYKKSQKYYTKQGADIYLRLKPYLQEAISNGSKLNEFDFDNSEIGLTQLNKLFETDEIKTNIRH